MLEALTKGRGNCSGVRPTSGRFSVTSEASYAGTSPNRAHRRHPERSSLRPSFPPIERAVTSDVAASFAASAEE